MEESLQKLSDPHPAPEKFREALRGISRRSREEVVRLWLTEGAPFAFRARPVIYEEMRGWLGACLNVCPKEITVVGSARIGFSLARSQFGRSFSRESDLDLSIVSEVLFGAIAETFSRWRQDYREGRVHPRSERERALWEQNLEFGERNLPSGFFDANKIPTFDPYPLVQRIQQTMWALTKKLEVTPDAPTPPRASTRVYRNWQDLIRRVSFNLYTVLSR